MYKKHINNQKNLCELIKNEMISIKIEIAKYTYYKKYESEYDRPIEINQYFKMTSDMKYFQEHKEG